MRKISYLLLFLLISFIGVGQNSFKINSPLADTVYISINGTKYLVDSNFQTIQTNFPDFDTLVFIDNGARSIIANFKSDSLYSIFYACCANYDIVPAPRLEKLLRMNWDYEENFNEIQELMLDKPRISFKVKNQTDVDFVYAWYVDYACFPRFKLIDDVGWNYGTPEKCFYWSNISSFEFFTTYAYLEDIKDENGVVHDYFPVEYDDFKSLNSIHTRLFDNNEYLIEYDLNTGAIKLDYFNPKIRE